jgi:hypothetical protein
MKLALTLAAVFAVASWGSGLPLSGEALACPSGTFDVLNYGAAGNGTSLDTTHIQAAIDAAEASGGGTVLLPSGHTFLSGSITLKSNITLEVAGTLLGSPNLSDYTQVTPAMTGVTYFWPSMSQYALIYANSATNITITGGGTIDGNALHTNIPFISGWTGNWTRPQVLWIIRCTTVNVNNITLKHSLSWMQHYLECSAVTLDHVTVINNVLFGEDGVDIDNCNGATIQNSTFTTWDDSVCLKSTSMAVCQNVTVNNCTISGTGCALKLGSESQGGFKHVLFENCTISSSYFGIGILELDGGHMSDITCRNITWGTVQYPIFVLLDARNRTIPGLPTPSTGSMDTIVLDTITGTSTNQTPCWISGIAGHNITNVTVKNCNLSLGGGDLNANDLYLSVPEIPTSLSYVPYMFGTLPAYGLYARHVSGLTLQNSTLGYTHTDYRPPLVFDNVSGLNIVDAPNYVHAEVDSHALAVAKWFGTTDATLNWTFDSALGKYKIWTSNGTGQVGGLPVTITYVSTGKPYSLGTANIGALVYIDRSYTITNVSQTLGGGILIRTANDDKNVTAANYLSFTVSQSATVYVCYDSRIGTLPAWLSDGAWTAINQTFSDSSGTPRHIYSRSVSAGSVTLGGNLAPPAVSTPCSNYVVVVKTGTSSGGGSGSYVLTNQYSGMDLNVLGASTAAEAQVIQWPHTLGATSAQWRLSPTGDGYYYITNVNSGMDLNVPKASTSADTGLIQYPHTPGAANAEWKITATGSGSFYVTNRNSGMDVNDPHASTSAGTQMVQYPHTPGASNAEWQIPGFTP